MDNNEQPNRVMTGHQEDKAFGPTIGLIIILVVIIIGGIYFWSTRETYAPQVGDINGNNQNEVAAPSDESMIGTQNSSDEINSIEADLRSFNEVDINALDSDL